MCVCMRVYIYTYVHISCMYEDLSVFFALLSFTAVPQHPLHTGTWSMLMTASISEESTEHQQVPPRLGACPLGFLGA